MNINIEGFFREVFKEARNKTTEEFISQAKQIHPEYDYSKVNYVNAHVKVMVGCPKHGFFEIAPTKLLGGQGCNRCGHEKVGFEKRTHQDDFIATAKKIYPKYDYSKVNYVNNITPVIVTCPVHGDFSITPNTLLYKHGCKRCNYENYCKSRASNTDEFVEKAKKVHPEYDYSKVKYIRSNLKVDVICPKHGLFSITPNSLLSGTGCPTCSKAHVPTTSEFINKAKKVHPEYDYSKSKYVNSTTPVVITCPIHGDFERTPTCLYRGDGCPKCGKFKRASARRSNTDEFVEKAKKIHPEYDYSKVKYVNAKTPIIIGCPIHGDFVIEPRRIINGSGCQKCARDYITKKQSKTNDVFIEEAKNVWPEYDYSKVLYKNGHEKIIVVCPKHGDFTTTPANLLRGHGCPRCVESKGERVIREWLEKNSISFKDQHRFQDFKKYPYDFYLPNYNIVIEFNGEQHYKKKENFFHREQGSFEGQLVRDHLKKAYAERNGIELLVIPYWDFDNIDKILSEKLLKN